MADRVRITDVAPRDGLQNEPGVASAADRVRLIESLAAGGVDEIEAGSFVSPRWVPQMADSSEVLGNALASLRRAGRRPALSVLVPNRRGFDAATPFHSDDWPLKIAVFTAASETFNWRNTNATIGESVDRFAEFVPEAIRRGMPVRMYVSCAVACPFEGPIAPGQVRRVCDLLADLAPGAIEEGKAEIDLGDTMGVATAQDIERVLGEFTDSERARLVLHLHDTYGRAAECVRVGLDMGVRSFDGSVAGLGGCPYASTKAKRAPGNLATETLVQTVTEAGFVTNVDMTALRSAGRIASAIVAGLRAGAVT